jgi:lipopolysaccharide assembly outer membrane protein LptD (OstA)
MPQPIHRTMLCAAAAFCLLFPVWAPGQNALTPGQLQSGQDDATQRAGGLIGGNKPFRLSADPTGDITYDFDPETSELRRVTARKNVVFAGDDLALNSDELEYDSVTGELIATGRRVVVRQGEITITCQLFRYNPATQQSELLGNPIIYNKGKDGKVTYVSGDKIVIFKANGRTQLKVTGDGGRAPVLSNSQDGALPVPSSR